eukprot:gene1342-11424_t
MEIQVLLPDEEKKPKRRSCFISTITFIPRVIFVCCFDFILFLIVAVMLFLASCCKVSFNYDPTSEKSKKSKIPILLIHGSEWIIGRKYLLKDEYGSIYSLNYDGLTSNDPTMGIDDYSKGKIRDKILGICKDTNQQEIILIGHSMGGLISGYYSEHLSESDNIQVKNIITIGSPWNGAPLLSCFPSSDKRMKQMTPNDSFLPDLISKMKDSESKNKRRYFSVHSSLDLMAPSSCARATVNYERDVGYDYLSHYGLVAHPEVWNQIEYWLDKIYNQNEEV